MDEYELRMTTLNRIINHRNVVVKPSKNRQFLRPTFYGRRLQICHVYFHIWPRPNKVWQSLVDLRSVTSM